MSQSIEEIVARVLAELKTEGLEPHDAATAPQTSKVSNEGGDLVIDLADPTLEGPRHAMLVDDPADPEGLRDLMDSTSARLGVGRAGPRPKTQTMLLFQADHGVTQDAIYGVVTDEVKDKFNLFTVHTRVDDRAEYLLRPDLGRLLSDEAKQELNEKCVKSPDVQICVADGLSAAAIDNNLGDIYPVIEQGLKSAGLSMGTPFFIENARVGVMNDINAIIKAKVLILLIGERPGLGIADAMSAYMGFDPQPGKSDADRDLICMITTHGGTNPLEAGAYIVEFIKRMIQYSASGVKLREVAGS
ncbi:ethanolamine ammonia-lyase subunit EutC [Propionimicrobium sp. PCR01-08-3]|uniref:ethanolamine ammonia-lyase subunit EutC n=1 Tax=Propionimicrobium sp. PCR01-08-3 TaxID=3052086 RepID=UPI00255CB7BD|nr:ethanolamine ammonia-lyase subunit EutC [Propionimicrobium sp. PCR01-08-3]WIY82132.1 ethanolamine ammonia-lyase subunit EutC [Propionimicrobium sp. PCR01-08-3]